ncbi:hypothetical protein Taro_048282 [Colocasia esculenta]|uniref:Uncharacterized protein n=1 Tax=Colocasia esculenta TaxID=4460 RepID=A0A843X2J7_COLES|nr:hypothetical protein [Colocasia esculenta]
MEDTSRQVQVWCSWSSSAHLSVCALRRLREPACGVAFTGAVLLSAEPVEVSRPCWLSPCCWGVCCRCCVFGLVYLCAVVRCARDAELSRCLACCVAPLVERCNTCLWLLSAWCWLVVSSGSSQECSAFVLGHRCIALWFEVCRLVGLRSGEVLPGRLLALFGRGSPQSCLVFALVVSALSLCGDELSLLPVGLSVLQSAWAFSVKVLCAWPCVWLLRWPACLIVRFQVSRLRWRDLCVPVA